jgi:hypothetical protein
MTEIDTSNDAVERIALVVEKWPSTTARDTLRALAAERDALRKQLEAVECHAEALENALNEPLWRFDNPIAPVALVGAAILLGWLLWRMVG